MGKMKDNETRQRIVEAARDLFVKHGQQGVNMRELALKADVNKGLLHYYFKTKEAIFQEVFQQHAGRLYSEVLQILEEEGPFEEKIGAMVERYFTLFSETPSLPAFVMFEIQRDPGMIARSPLRETMMKVVEHIGPELKRRKLPEDRNNGLQFLLDMVSLCAFTFAMLPALGKAMKHGKRAQQAFLAQRQQHITSVLKYSLKP